MDTIRTKAEAMLERCEVISVASVDENGFPRPVPLVKIKSCGFHEIWFATGVSSEKTKHFQQNDKAGICLFEKGDSVAVTGNMEVVTNLETKEALWQAWFYNFFPQGVTDPEYCLLKFSGQKATLYIDLEFVRQDL